MPGTFRKGNLSFRYPDNWRLEREDNDNGWTVSVFSPDTAFLTICLDTDHPDNSHMAAAALEALRSDYPELEAEERAEMVAGQWAVGHDISFFSFDWTNTCWTRCFESPEGTVLILCQVSDLDGQEDVLRAVYSSLRIDEVPV